MTTSAPQNPASQALRQGYEPPDVSYVGLVIFFIVFVAVGFLIHFALAAILDVYLHEPRSVDAITSAAPKVQRFPAPNLQPTQSHNELPREDLHDLQVEKNRFFNQLGWTLDPITGAPIIPDEVISRLAQQRGSKSPPPMPSGGAR